jgi:hypothetical protein
MRWDSLVATVIVEDAMRGIESFYSVIIKVTLAKVPTSALSLVLPLRMDWVHFSVTPVLAFLNLSPLRKIYLWNDWLGLNSLSCLLLGLSLYKHSLWLSS